MGRRVPRGRRDDDRGAAAVEFALVAMPLFLVLFGIIQYGFLFYELQGAAAASKDAAKWASEGMTDCAAWKQKALDRADSYGVTGGLSPEISATVDTPATGSPTVTVTVRFTPSQLVPLIPVPGTVERTATADLQSFPADGQTPCGP